MSQTQPRNQQDQQVTEQRQRVILQVRERFARHGDDVCNAVMVAALQPNGLQKLLNDLGLPPTPRYSDQLNSLARFVVALGAFEFTRRLRPRQKAGMDAESRMVNPMENPVLSQAGARLAEPPAPATPPDTPPVSPSAPVAPEPEGLNSAGLFDEAGTYIGPERRKGIDRRRSIDRRNAIDAVSGNRRYGGDRRRGQRRKTD